MKTHPIAYRIAQSLPPTGAMSFCEVRGLAVDSPTGVRYCVRHSGFDFQADDYDTGYRIGKYYETLQNAIEGTERLLRERGMPAYQKARSGCLGGLQLMLDAVS